MTQAWGLPWTVGDKFKDPPLEEINYPLSVDLNWRQLFGYAWNPCLLFSLSAWSPSGWILCRPCAYFLNLWVHMCVSPVGSVRHCFLAGIHKLWLLKSFSLLVYLDHWALREEFDDLGLNAPKSLTLHSVHFWVTVLVPIWCKKKLLWW